MPTYFWRGDELVDGRDSYPPVRTIPWDEYTRVDDPPPWPSRYPHRDEIQRLPGPLRDLWKRRWAILSTEYESQGIPFPQHEALAWNVVKCEMAEGKMPDPEPVPEDPVEPPKPTVAEKPKGKKRGHGPEGGGIFR
jgi:hypothetical protein